jgi:hypothetical protein
MMNHRSKFLNWAFLPYAVTILLSIIAALIYGHQFIGWPLNAPELDFMILHSVLGKRDVFAGSVYLPLAENVARLSILPFVASQLEAWGVIAERQVVYLNFLQIFFMCLGPAAMFWLILRGRSPWLMPIALVLFILSGVHYLAYFKLITSTLVSGIVILVIAMTTARFYKSVAILLGVIGVVHPTYFLVTAAAVFFMQWCGSGPFLNRKDMLGRLKPLKPCLIVMVPFFGYWFVNAGMIVTPEVDRDVWISYMQARSDLAFPLRQGLFFFLETVGPLLLAALIFRRESEIRIEPGLMSLWGMALFAASLVFVQILSSEVLRSPSLTSLALSHRIPFTFMIACYAGLVAIALRYFVEGRGKLHFWFGTLLFVLLGAGLPRSLPVSHNLKILAFSVWVFSLQLFETSEFTRKRIIAICWQICMWLGIGVVIVLIFGKQSYRSLPLLGILMVAEWFFAAHWADYEKWLGKVSPFILVSCLLSVVAYYVAAKDWKAISVDWLSFSGCDTVGYDANYRQGRSEYREFIRFVTDHVGPTEQILTVPFFITQSFNPVPYRSVFLDWGESNYVLYQRDYVSKVIEKLASYGIDPDEKPAECTVGAMILAKPFRDKAYRCQRRALQAQAQNKKMEWRGNIPKIKELAPRVSWVLIKQDAICSGDEIEARWGDFGLVRLENAAPFADCVRDEKS